MKLIKREYCTLINTITKNVIVTLPKSNLYKLIENSLKSNMEKIFNYDVDKNLPNLHRWCNNTSNRYKNTCNWEKKLTLAGQDNCIGKY